MRQSTYTPQSWNRIDHRCRWNREAVHVRRKAQRVQNLVIKVMSKNEVHGTCDELGSDPWKGVVLQHVMPCSVQEMVNEVTDDWVIAVMEIDVERIKIAGEALCNPINQASQWT